MKKGAIKYIVGGALVLVGLIFCGIAASMGGTQLIAKGFTIDLSGLHINSGETVSLELDVDGIENIIVDSGCSNFKLVTGNTDKVIVECSEIHKNLLSATSSGDTINIKYSTEFKWFSWFSNYGTIVVTIPESLALNDFDFKNSVGESTIDGISAKNIHLTNSVGSLSCTDIKADYIDCEVDVGELQVKGMTCSELDSDTGVGEAKFYGTVNGDASFVNGVGESGFEGAINGDIKVENGIGEIDISLKGNRDDYRDNVDNGIGEVDLDGVNGGSDAKYTIDINNGIGEVNVSIED